MANDNLIVEEKIEHVTNPVPDPLAAILAEKKFDPTPVMSVTATKPATLGKPSPATKVKLLCNWMTSKDLANLWNKMSQGDYTWNDIHIVWDEEPDYYVICNCPPINEFPPPNKTIVFQMEPRMPTHPELWGEWADPPRDIFIKVCRHKEEYHNTDWHISKSYSELRDSHPTKDEEITGILSTVLSAKYHDPGHIKRVDFVHFLEKKGLPVHVFGDNKWEYKDYKGSLPYHCKENALFPYKYTFNVENHSDKNVFTEKIVDGLLSECLTFYNGCFNRKPSRKTGGARGCPLSARPKGSSLRNCNSFLVWKGSSTNTKNKFLILYSVLKYIKSNRYSLVRLEHSIVLTALLAPSLSPPTAEPKGSSRLPKQGNFPPRPCQNCD
jgi:hypothetical protein